MKAATDAIAAVVVKRMRFKATAFMSETFDKRSLAGAEQANEHGEVEQRPMPDEAVEANGAEHPLDPGG